jgi:predicted RNase H-like nuclease (RuvC/YqgF family)
MANLDEVRNSAGCAAPLLDEIRGVIYDVLAISGISISRTIELIEDRTRSGAAQTLRAAVLVVREQRQRLDEAEARIGDLGDDNARLEDEVADLETKLEALRAQPKKRVPA